MMGPKLHWFPRSRPPQLPERKRVTLISALCCTDHLRKKAFVISADSQETIEHQRCFLVKIEPRTMGNFQIAIGGSGLGDLIDAFLLRLEDFLSTSPATQISDLRTLIQDQLLEFMRTEVEAYPARKASKHLRFIIGALASRTGECECWITKSSRLKKIDRFEIIGCEEPLYRFILERLFSKNLTVGQAVRLSVYLFMVAKKTSLYIDGPTSMAIVRDIAISMEDDAYVKEVEGHVGEMNKASDSLAITLPDIGMSALEFDLKLQEFVENVKAVRKRYVELAGLRMWGQLVQEGHMPTVIYPKVPDSSSIEVKFESGGITKVSVLDDPSRGIRIGHFWENTFVCEDRPRTNLCGKRRVVGNRVFAQVVPCTHAGRHIDGGTCISDTWLQTIEANYSDY